MLVPVLLYTALFLLQSPRQLWLNHGSHISLSPPREGQEPAKLGLGQFWKDCTEHLLCTKGPDGEGSFLQEAQQHREAVTYRDHPQPSQHVHLSPSKARCSLAHRALRWTQVSAPCTSTAPSLQ